MASDDERGAVLELEGVAKRYRDGGEDVRAVDGVSIRLRAGEVTALYGPSGSGKTTLLLMAAGLLAPDDGLVRLCGEDLMTMDGGRLRTLQLRHIGFVYQSPHLMSGVPAVENAAIKLLAAGQRLRDARRPAVELLERVGLADRLGHTPEQLSGGERQRVAVARALINSPRLVLADEPTGSLDSRRGRAVLDLIGEESRRRGAAVLLATHDPAAAEIADHVLVLSDGRLSSGADAGLPAGAGSPRVAT